MNGLTTWPECLEAAIGGTDGFFRRAFVLPETDSTQDAARRLEAEAGDVVATGRQRTGRGRRGRAWEDTGEQGVAVTFVIEPRDPAFLAIAGAVAVARTLERFIAAPLGLKWPNDVMVGDRKLAGLLAERSGDLVYLGIGINVSQTSWPPGLADRAISLREMGAVVDRLAVMTALIETLPRILRAPAPEIAEAFAARDTLVGTVRTFDSAGGEMTARVLEIDPMRGMAVEGPGGRIWLDAATTTLIR